MTYIDVHAPNGAHLFKYDPARSLVQIKVKGLGLLTVDLEQYHVAKAIRSCKKESMRPGVLRVIRALPELKH